MSRKKTVELIFALLFVLLVVWMAPLFLEPGSYLRLGLEEFRVIAMGVSFGLGFAYVLFGVKGISKKLTAQLIAGFILIGIAIWGLPLLLDPTSNLRFAIEELRVLILGVDSGIVAGFAIFNAVKTQRRRR